MNAAPREALGRRLRRVRVNLWALITPPVVWAGHFLFCYGVAAVYCEKSGRSAGLMDVRVASAVATVLALLLVLAAGCVAWREVQRAGGASSPHDESTDEDRARFLGTCMLLLAALSFAAIVFTAIPAVVFGDCR